MNITRKGNRWVLDWYDAGHRRRKHYHTEAQARRAQQQKQRIAAETPPRQPPKHPLALLAEQFAATRAGATPTHYKQTRHVTSLLASHLPPNVPPTQLHPQHFAEFRQHLRRYRTNTRIIYESTVRAFLQWLWKAAHVHAPPSELFPSSRLRQERRQTTIDPDTAARIINAAPKNTAPLVRLLATLGREAGLRISEVTKAQCGDWNRATRTLTIRSSKNHPHRANPANPTLAAYLDALIPTQAPPDQNLTALLSPTGRAINPITLRRHWQTARRKANAPHITPHDLRRTWATEHADHCPLPVLMELAGWTQPQTAIHYLMSRGQEPKRAAVARAWNARQAHTLEPPDPGPGESQPPQPKKTVN